MATTTYRNPLRSAYKVTYAVENARTGVWSDAMSVSLLAYSAKGARDIMTDNGATIISIERISS